MIDYFIAMAIFQSFFALMSLIFTMICYDDRHVVKNCARVTLALFFTAPLGGVTIPLGAVAGIGWGSKRLWEAADINTPDLMRIRK